MEGAAVGIRVGGGMADVTKKRLPTAQFNSNTGRFEIQRKKRIPMPTYMPGSHFAILLRRSDPDYFDVPILREKITDKRESTEATLAAAIPFEVEPEPLKYSRCPDGNVMVLARAEDTEHGILTLKFKMLPGECAMLKEIGAKNAEVARLWALHIYHVPLGPTTFPAGLASVDNKAPVSLANVGADLLSMSKKDEKPTGGWVLLAKMPIQIFSEIKKVNRTLKRHVLKVEPQLSSPNKSDTDSVNGEAGQKNKKLVKEDPNNNAGAADDRSSWIATVGEMKREGLPAEAARAIEYIINMQK